MKILNYLDIPYEHSTIVYLWAQCIPITAFKNLPHYVLLLIPKIIKRNLQSQESPVSKAV